MRLLFVRKFSGAEAKKVIEKIFSWHPCTKSQDSVMSVVIVGGHDRMVCQYNWKKGVPVHEKNF